MQEYSIVDLETTGFSFTRGHRIVEIAVVNVNDQGEIVDEWETIVNPMRHMGASDIHGLLASDVIGAPTFTEIAGELCKRLDGRVLIAHNANFDASFLAQELCHYGYLGDPHLPSLDTLALSRRLLDLSSYRLEDVCRALSIINPQAHSALADARATAQILQSMLKLRRRPFRKVSLAKLFGHVPDVCGGFAEVSAPRSPSAMTRAEARRIREELASSNWIAKVVGSRTAPTGDVAREYFALLDKVLLDRHMSFTEEQKLLEFAQTHDLSIQAIESLHQQYAFDLVRAVEADGVLTPNEQSMLNAVKTYLGVPVEQFLNPQVLLSEVATDKTGFVLSSGDRVAVTGPLIESTQYWEQYFNGRGVSVAGVAKTTKLLVAGDPDSMSGKAKKARQYGIPIVSELVAKEILTFE